MYTNDRRKASIASGFYPTCANFPQGAPADASIPPPPYVTLHRRVSAVQKAQNDQNRQHPHFTAPSAKEAASDGPPSTCALRHPTNRRSSQNSSLRALFSTSSTSTPSENSSKRKSSQIILASTNLRTRARLCASAGDLSRDTPTTWSPKISLKSGKFLESFPRRASTAQAPTAVSSCWRSRRKSSNRSVSSGGGDDEDIEEAYYYRVKITQQTSSELSKPALLARAMAPPQTASSTVANNGTQQEKSGKVKNTTKSGTHSHPTSFMSRFFATNADKQRRRQQEQQQKISTHSKTASAIEAKTLEKEGVTVPEHRLFTKPQSNGPPNSENDPRSNTVFTQPHDNKNGDKLNKIQAQPAYSTSSLGRYASKLKQQLSPPVVLSRETGREKGATDNNDTMKEAGSVHDLAGSNLGPASTQLSTSLKTLSQLSATKRELKLGAGSENDLYSSIPSAIVHAQAGPVESNSDYRRSLISSIGAAAAAARSRTGFARPNEESNKKSKSLISNSLAVSTSAHRPEGACGSVANTKNSDRSSSISGSSGSISKGGSSGGLAGKISRGIIQEFASSSERLMSWKAKLKKTKREMAPGQATEEGEEEENEDDRLETVTENADVFERQNLADFTAKSDPLPRTPKYVYKTNSMDSNYDMAIGAYDSQDTTVEQSDGHPLTQWTMGQKRAAQGGRPDGFYVGLTLVNTGALETENGKVAPDGSGVYFLNGGDSSSISTTTTAPATSGSTSGSVAGPRSNGGSFQKSNRAQSQTHFSQHSSSAVEEGTTKLSAAAFSLDESTKHYEEIDLATVNWKEPNALTNMDCHHHHQYHYQGQTSGQYNVQQQSVSHSGFKNDELPPLPPNMQGSYGSEDVSLPPPSRITPYSGVPQAKEGEIVRPIAFRPVAAASSTNSVRSQSMSNPSSVSNEIVVVSPMKQAQMTTYRHSSPSNELAHSNYDNTHGDASHRGAHNTLSAFTPPTARRSAHHLSVTSNATNADSQSMPEDEDRLSTGSRTRDAHSMTPARTWHSKEAGQNETTNSGWQIRVAQPPPPQQRPHPISYQDYLRHSQQNLEQQHQRFSQIGHVKPTVNNGGNGNAQAPVQNEYDVIADIRSPPNKSNFSITPTGNRSFDFGVGPQKKAPQIQNAAPPARNTATFAVSHHHPQSQQTQTQFSLHHQPSGPTDGGVSGGSQNYGSLGSRNSSGIHVTPSPSDSGVAELEVALREKENELVHLRQTMEHNEQAIMRVYQEKEQRWQDKLREWAMRLEHAVATEQRFLLEVDQLQNERTDLHNRAQTLLAEKQGLQRKCKELETELFAAKARLEERRQTNWIVCKQCGCVLTFESRQNSASATTPDDDMVSSRDSHHLPDPPFPPGSQSPRVRYRRTPPPSLDEESGNNINDNALRSEVDSLKMEVSGLRQSLHDQVAVFNTERRRWELEKQRVLQYQKLLEDAYQINCIQQQQEQRLSTHSTPTGTMKGVKEFSVHPYAYGSLPSPFHTGPGNNLNLVHSEPELEV